MPLLPALLSSAVAWCCRACGRCMCDSYGVCGVKASAMPPLPTWSAADVASFIESLAENGSRNLCPSGCRTPSLFNGSRFDGMSGLLLHELLTARSAAEAQLRSPNATAAEKANASALRAQLALGLLPHNVDATRVAPAFFNRLHTAITAASSQPPADHTNTSARTTPTLASAPVPRQLDSAPVPRRLDETFASAPVSRRFDETLALNDLGLLVSILGTSEPSVWANVRHSLRSLRPRWSSLAVDLWSRPANVSALEARRQVRVSTWHT